MPENVVLTEYDRNGSGDEFDKERSLTANFHHTFQDRTTNCDWNLQPPLSAEAISGSPISTCPTHSLRLTTTLSSVRMILRLRWQPSIRMRSAGPPPWRRGNSADISRTTLGFYAENFDPARNQFVEDTAKTSSYRFNRIDSLFHM